MNLDYTKTVTIPIKIVNGEIKYFYDEDATLEQLQELSYGELTVVKHLIGNDEIISKLSIEKEVDFFPKSTKLFVHLSNNDFDKIDNSILNLMHKAKDFRGWSIEGSFLEITLVEDLKLTLRGSKKARLLPVKCSVAILTNDTNSLNQIYTLISQKVEPSRRSHSGNVFDKIYYKDVDGYRKIGDKRDSLEAQYESENLVVVKK